MQATPEPSRPATRQARTGERLRAETRRRLVQAAALEFEAHGYAGATVERIAAAAGVTVQTLYAAAGSKRELLRAVLTTALADDDDPTRRFVAAFTEGDAAPQRSDDPAASGAGGEGPRAPGDARAQVARLVELFLAVARRAGGVWRVYQDAAAVDPVIAADWQDLHVRRRGTIRALVQRIPAQALRTDADRAVETVWALASPEMWGLLVGRGGQGPEEFAGWLRAALERLLLAD